MFYKDRIYHITPGDIAITNKYELHSLCDWDKPGYSNILIDFKEDFLKDFKDLGVFKCFDKDIIVISPQDKDSSRAYEKFNDILGEYNGNLPNRDSAIKIKTAELLIYISRMQDTYGDKKENADPSQLIIEAIMKYININYKNKINLQEIADFMGYSKNYICAYFKKHSGFSIVEYINGQRIKKSQDLLKNSAMSVTEISSECGFESITHFGRTFKLIVGCSPLQYRKITKE